jgi:hypothetical protein
VQNTAPNNGGREKQVLKLKNTHIIYLRNRPLLLGDNGKRKGIYVGKQGKWTEKYGHKETVS